MNLGIAYREQVSPLACLVQPTSGMDKSLIAFKDIATLKIIFQVYIYVTYMDEDEHNYHPLATLSKHDICC